MSGQVTSGGLALAPVTGIDVSPWQAREHTASRRDVDWTKVAAAGHRFAFIKATEGVHYKSPSFRRQWEGALAAGLLVGPYHFLRWEVGAARGARQARAFFGEVGALAPGHFDPVVDLEWITGHRRPAKEITAIAVEFVDETAQLFQRDPIIYTGPTFWKFHVRPAGVPALRLTRQRLWKVDYTLPYEDMDGAPDWHWTWHQHTSKGRVPGVPGNCDLNVFAGTLEDLRELARLPRARVEACP